jgi:putative DNA primase/helicase
MQTKTSGAPASDMPSRLDPSTFPHQPKPGAQNLPTTIENIEHLLTANGIVARYNVIKKKGDLRDGAGRPISMNTIISVASLQGLSTGLTYGFIDEIADRNPTNPVADWIGSKAWDGTDRLPAFYATVEEEDGYPTALKCVLLHRWLLSAVAAAIKPRGFHSRGVLTLQGGQGIGKTSWIARLINDTALKEQVIKLDHHLDAGNKDSIIAAMESWLVEIGELEGSFRRDVARLKGLLTSDCDKLRKPYARGISEYPRRTVFAATVNDHHFLVDTTGNSRWWTIGVKRLDYNHDIDMQQVFAQLATQFHNGAQWWLTPEEEAELTAYNRQHEAVSVVRERVLNALDLSRDLRSNDRALTASEVLREAGINYPSNSQCKECGQVLREHLGPPKRIQGRDRWRVPLHTSAPLPGISAVVYEGGEEDDGY